MNLFDFKKRIAEAFPNAESISASVEYWKGSTSETLTFRCAVFLPGTIYYNSEYGCLSFEEAFDSLLKAAGRHPAQFAAMKAGNDEFGRQGFQKDAGFFAGAIDKTGPNYVDEMLKAGSVVGGVATIQGMGKS